METITSRNNERVKDISLLCENAGVRAQRGLCVTHGIKLCSEAAKHSGLVSLWVTPEALERYGEMIEDIATDCGIVGMSDSVCEKLSPQRSPQGVIAVARIPKEPNVSELVCKKRILALCSVQDPANVGTMIRTAAGVGYDAAILSGECADAFSPKALRASMGAAFSLSTVRCDITGLLETLEAAGHLTVATALGNDSVSLCGLGAQERLTLLIGNEGSGLSDELVKRCSTRVTIPMSDRIESYNAAAAACIAMWETRP